MAKLQENDGTFVLTLPEVKLLQLGWKKGDLLDVEIDRNAKALVVRKVKNAD